MGRPCLGGFQNACPSPMALQSPDVGASGILYSETAAPLREFGIGKVLCGTRRKGGPSVAGRAAFRLAASAIVAEMAAMVQAGVWIGGLPPWVVQLLGVCTQGCDWQGYG